MRRKGPTVSASTLTAPHNPTTGKEYSGGNVPVLRDAMDSCPGLSGQFATFRQWLATGRSVIKGQKAIARLTYYGEQKVEQADGTTKKGGFASSFCVFAFEQTQPVEGDDKPTDHPTELAKEGSWKAAEVKETEDDKDLRLQTLTAKRLIEKAQRLQREAAA